MIVPNVNWAYVFIGIIKVISKGGRKNEKKYI